MKVGDVVNTPCGYGKVQEIQGTTVIVEIDHTYLVAFDTKEVVELCQD